MSTTSNIYLSEYERLKTFQNGWPHSFLSPEVMAKCGFYYLGVNDEVKCPFCNVVVFNWSIGDEPIREHIRTSRNCRFVNGYEVGNIFIGDDPRQIFDLTPGEDVCGLIILKNSESKQIDSNEPGIPFREPSHLDYITYDSRLASFKDWTSQNIAPPKLAEAGFFFRGVAEVNGEEIVDAVTCFHCGESLSGWTKDDNAWEEHAKFSPKCSFIYLLTAFETSRMHQNTLSSTFLPYLWLTKATDEDRCSVCFEFSASICFNPCSHSTCSICAAALLKCPICRSNIKRLTKISKEIPSVESLAIESPTVESSTVESPTVESTTVDSPAVESPTIDTATAESPTPAVESSTVESSVVESSTMDSTTAESSTVGSSAVESPAVDSSTLNTATAESPTPAVESSVVESSTMESATAESSTVGSSAVESPAVESSTVDTATAESPTPAVESSVVESSTVESTTIESPTVESKSVEPHVKESQKKELTKTLKKQTLKSASKVIPVIKKATEKQSAIDQPKKESSQSSP